MNSDAEGEPAVTVVTDWETGAPYKLLISHELLPSQVVTGFLHLMTPGSLRGREGGTRCWVKRPGGNAAWEKEEQRQRKLRGSALGSTQMQRTKVSLQAMRS